MGEMASSNTVDLLRHLHETLDTHFTALRISREALEPSSPVFALEHDRSPEDLDLLASAVRAAVREGLGAGHRQWWLPFVVYAAESGYEYVGDEYWHTFEQSTPGWRDEHRSWIKIWFQRFAESYGGAVPTGAFAEFFKIIAWPITNAVLPVYLQQQLAKLLFEFSGALTSELLDNPAALGTRLARRASNYTERFRIFCENTTLVGQVAAALLSGENEPTPYLLPSTLNRIVEGLSEERQARHWLKSARLSASRVRGVRREGEGKATSAGIPKDLPRATDPRLFLRFDGTWNAFATLPDLTALGMGLPGLYNQLRASRATVSGCAGPVMPSTLLYAGQEVQFGKWPRVDQPFLQLARADENTNHILADQCAITRGPWWLFRRQGAGLAVEVKGKFVRPGHSYVLVGAAGVTPPAVPWSAEVAIAVEDVRAYALSVPEQLSEVEEAALLGSGIAVVSNVAIRPVGVVAAAWDGEGEAEWLAGESATIGIRSDLLPKRCRIVAGGLVYFLDWTPGEVELLFCLESLPVATHELEVTLLGDGDRQLANGSLVVTIRDPQVRPEGASAGEGIRMLPTPARPTLSELWDERAIVTIDGPVGTDAELQVKLRDGAGNEVAKLRRSVRLPVDEASWKVIAKAIRADQRFGDSYDEAESCVVTVARDSVGFATLTCERGFQPLRWRFRRSHDGLVVASLVDRTDGGNTMVDFFDVEAPLTAIHMDARESFDVPPRGGLAVATAGDATAAAVLPTNPNAVLRLPPAHPLITSPKRSAREILRLAAGHQTWLGADLPADAFANYEQQLVGDAIARSIGTLIGGGHWAALERKLANAREAADHLDSMQDGVGIAQEHKALASTIAYRLYKWLNPEDLLLGFHQVITPSLASCGITDKPATARFLLMLAGRPGYITEWEPSEATFLLDRVLLSPVLYRAARFAVLGTRALNDAEGLERGF